MQNLPHSVGQTKRTISPPLGAGKSTKLPAHLRQVKQLSLTRLFSAESLGFPRSREEERALCLPKEQGRVCTLPCLREGSFTLQDGAHFWSLHPPPALNISSPISGMFAISQNSFMPDFICLFNLSRSTSANRIFSNVSKLTSVQQRTQLTNNRFDNQPIHHSFTRSSLAPLLFFLLHMHYGLLRVYRLLWKKYLEKKMYNTHEKKG
ncbi:hypothetical protein T06_7993 [Trichinella sp. T6]|nr:hypothetical protein T06_7993 [Trichinella sp. T6]